MLSINSGENPVTKRVYRRFKKAYNAIPRTERERFLFLSELHFSNLGK